MNLTDRYMKTLEFDQNEWDEEVYGEFMDNLTEALSKMNPSGLWHVEGKNMGWQKRSGSKDFSAGNADQFMGNIMPHCNCSGKIEIQPSKLLMTVYHHDAPTGETYEVTKFKEAEEE